MRKYSDTNEISPETIKNSQTKNEESKPLEINNDNNNLSFNNEGENESFESDENMEESVNDSENNSELKKLILYLLVK